MRLYQHIILFIIVLLTSNLVFGQQATIHVVDQKTNEPIIYAHVCFESVASGEQSHELTDESGMVINPCKERCIVAISYVGYATLFDTVSLGESKILLLKPTVFDIDQVVVTAQYSPQKVDKSIYKVKVIGAKRIQQKGATNLAEIFTNELGVSLNQSGVFGTNLSIRGLGGENLKVLIDGVPVIGRLNGNLDLGQMNINNADHIEMVEGPMSVIYGSNALAGVLNIITKENNKVPLTGNINAYYESVGTYNFNGSVSVSRKRNIIGISGGRNFFDGYTLNPEVRSMFWRPKRQYNIDGYYVYNHPKYKIKYSSQYFDELLLDKGDVIAPHFARDNHLNTIRFNNSLNFQTKIGNYRYVKLLAAYSIYNRNRNTYFKNLHTLDEILSNNVGDQDTSRFDAIVARAEISKSTDKSKFNYQFGVDINIENGSGGKIDGKKQIGDYAGFLSMKYNPIPTFTLQPGFRLIHNTKYNAPLVYSLNIKYDITEFITLRGSYARGFRAPTLKELYLYFVDVNHNVRGNENLEAENSHNVLIVAGYHKEKGKATYGFNVDLFYNHINNAINLVGVGLNDGLYTYKNLYQYISQGFQLEMYYNLYPYFEWKIGLAETGRKNFDNEEIEAYNNFFYSTDINSTLVYYFPSINASISLFYKYTGKLEMLYEDEEGLVQQGFIEGYHNVDVTLGKSFINKSLQLNAGVKNILDIKTIDALAPGIGNGHSGGVSGNRNVGYGRTFFMSLSYNFQKF